MTQRTRFLGLELRNEVNQGAMGGGAAGVVSARVSQLFFAVHLQMSDIEFKAKPQLLFPLVLNLIGLDVHYPFFLITLSI
jgi:hypothetical protein